MYFSGGRLETVIKVFSCHFWGVSDTESVKKYLWLEVEYITIDISMQLKDSMIICMHVYVHIK